MGTTAAEVREDAGILQRNLAALALRNGWLVRAIQNAPERDALSLEHSPDGRTIIGSLNGRALASRRRPLDEARCWADSVNLDANALVAVVGFGLGYHAAALAERFDELTAMLIVEPDLALLRSVLGCIDHSTWIARHEIRFITNTADVGSLVSAMRGLEAPLSFGLSIVPHPPSVPRLGGAIESLNELLPQAVASLRTHIITTLVQSDQTISNALSNAERYAMSPGIADLEGIAMGRLGVVVSAGPSLMRNVGLLRDPAVRVRCLVVAVQTVLKPLLRLGIRPDFVTAIDYAEISRRFYEGLTEDDVRGITLVATARAHPAIHEAWPGARRIAQEELLDTMLGQRLTCLPDDRQRGSLSDAATVAHQAYSLARFMGCDPVALIGQDLAFTDGQYYSEGAAIHTTWGGELNSFNTIEMLEWQRIVRMRQYLYEREDHLGRPVYTDEQMMTYAAQFEQLFAADAGRGLRTIDATEGGLAKKHTTISPLAEVLRAYAGATADPISAIPAPLPSCDTKRGEAVRERLHEIRLGIRRIARLSRETEQLLDRVERCVSEDEPRVDALVRQIHRHRDEVHATEPAWTLVQRLSQMAALKRYAADRRIARGSDLPERDRFLLRVERDRVNVRWIGEASDHLDGVLSTVIAAGDETIQILPAIEDCSDGVHASISRARMRIHAVLVDRSGVGAEPVWDRPLHSDGPSALMMLLDRLDRSTRLSGVLIVTEHHNRARIAIGSRVHGRLPVAVLHAQAGDQRSERSRRIARSVAPACWRGAIGGLTVFDELFDAPRITSSLHRSNFMGALDGIVLAGIDWCCIDPVLTDRLIERHEQSPEQFGIVFSQAVPGLCPILISKKNLEEFANGQSQNAPFSSIAGALCYVPTQPRPDPVGRSHCLPVEGPVRDAGVRLIADTARGRDAIRAATKRIDGSWAAADGAAIAQLAAEAAPLWPAELVVSCGKSSASSGLMAAWHKDAGSGFSGDGSSPATVRQILDLIGDAARDMVVTIGLAGWRGWHRVRPMSGHRPHDPLDGDRWRSIVDAARSGGAGTIHVRTDLSHEDDAERLLEAGVDIVSIDAWANDAALYHRITGYDAMRVVFENIARLLSERQAVQGLPHPWVVPRITRCDETYDSIEAFYDKWLMLSGAAAIDPLPLGREQSRIRPLSPPSFVCERLCRERMVLLSDECIASDDGTVVRSVPPIDALLVWRQLCAGSAEQSGCHDHGFRPGLHHGRIEREVA